MTPASVAPLLYSLDETCPVSWTESAETQLHHDYPFFDQENTDENFVIRRYLETLWLPESFNALSNLISSLLRVLTSSDAYAPQPHPLHSLLEPLLLSTRAASEKYRTELMQILSDGGGAGEQEEAMMWYAYEYEKTDEGEGGNLDEEKWRKSWLERLERRETMIQILLNMLKLSLPGPRPEAARQQTNKKRGMRNKKHELPPETDEERLESHMDKIAVWQLTASFTGAPSSQGVGSSQGIAKADRHWTQVFCEDVVEPLFRAQLPEQCALLRSKVFPESAFSDAEDSDIDGLLDGSKSRAGSRAPSVSRGIRPGPRPLTRVPSVALPTAVPTGTTTGPAQELQRSRSRSLSVSIARDEAAQRASFVEQKRALSREVSMSRAFRDKPRPSAKLKTILGTTKAQPSKSKRDVGVTLVEETPAKRRRGESVAGEGWRDWDRNEQTHKQFSVPTPPPTSSSDPGDLCIEDTPVVMRKRQMEREGAFSPLSSMAVDESVCPAPTTGNKKTGKYRGKKKAASTTSQAVSRSLRIRMDSTASEREENVEESYTNSFGASNVTLLGDTGTQNGTMALPARSTRMRKGNRRQLPMLMDDDGDINMDTPTKKRAQKR